MSGAATARGFALSGAGGGALDPALFVSRQGGEVALATIPYPGWARYVEAGYTPDDLVDDLAARIAAGVDGPIIIVGNSIGGHLGYAVALRLAQQGRDIGGLCLIDSFMIQSAAPRADWKRRLLAQAAGLVRARRLNDLVSMVRSRFWRALFRLAGARLSVLLRAYAPRGRLPWALRIDPMFEQELNMRLLIRCTAAWIGALDRDPAPLRARSVLIRTPATAGDDAAWRRRCPELAVVEISGTHHTLFEGENATAFRRAFTAATQDWFPS